MKPLIIFADLLKGLQCLPEREKLILVALINAHGTRENEDKIKIERLVAETLIAATREIRAHPPENSRRGARKQVAPDSEKTSKRLKAPEAEWEKEAN